MKNFTLRNIIYKVASLESAYRKVKKQSSQININYADSIFNEVIDLLDGKETDPFLNKLIGKAKSQTKQLDSNYLDDPKKMQQIINDEINELKHFGITESQIINKLQDFKALEENPSEFVGNTEELKSMLTKMHEEAMSEFRVAPTLSKTKKKKLKNSTMKGLTSSTFGLTVILANSLSPETFAFSYIIGGTAIHTALRDFIGNDD